MVDETRIMRFSQFFMGISTQILEVPQLQAYFSWKTLKTICNESIKVLVGPMCIRQRLEHFMCHEKIIRQFSQFFMCYPMDLGGMEALGPILLEYIMKLSVMSPLRVLVVLVCIYRRFETFYG